MRTPSPGRTGPRRLGKAERSIQDLKRIGPHEWVYVGDWPSEVFTTSWSPPWENSFIHVTGKRVAFRWGMDGGLEFKGQIDLTAGAVTGTVAFTLPPEWLGETFDFPFPVFVGGTDWQMAVMSVDGDTGECTVFWPIQATAI